MYVYTSVMTPFQLLLQYLFDVTKETDEILISLQQRDMKIHRPQGHGENLTIGFGIFKVSQCHVTLPYVGKTVFVGDVKCLKYSQTCHTHLSE